MHSWVVGEQRVPTVFSVERCRKLKPTTFGLQRLSLIAACAFLSLEAKVRAGMRCAYMFACACVSVYIFICVYVETRLIVNHLFGYLLRIIPFVSGCILKVQPVVVSDVGGVSCTYNYMQMEASGAL